MAERNRLIVGRVPVIMPMFVVDPLLSLFSLVAKDKSERSRYERIRGWPLDICLLALPTIYQLISAKNTNFFHCRGSSIFSQILKRKSLTLSLRYAEENKVFGIVLVGAYISGPQTLMKKLLLNSTFLATLVSRLKSRPGCPHFSFKFPTILNIF